jgi:hypothetical protein
MYASLIGRIGDIWRRIVAFVGRRLMARQRGLKLLEANLTPDQLKQFLATRRFDVVGGVTGRTYRIRMAAGPMHVQELDHRGHCVRRLCFYPRGRLVDGDIMLAQKVALEAFEVEALAIANKFPPKMLNL